MVRKAFLLVFYIVLSQVYPCVSHSQNREDQHRTGINAEEYKTSYNDIKETLRNLFASEVDPVDNDKTIRIDRTLPDDHVIDRALIKPGSSSVDHTENLMDGGESGGKNGVSIGKESGNGESGATGKGKKYTNEWVIHAVGGSDMAAAIVKDLGYEYLGPVRGFTDIYRVRHDLKHHNMRREAVQISQHISSHHQVVWAEQQFVLKREKRSPLVTDAAQPNSQNNPKRNSQWRNFNDELWNQQWYLYEFEKKSRKFPAQIGLNVVPVWRSGITGKGIRIIVVDDGLEWSHQDIINSYDAAISYDVDDDDSDPSPNSNGTMVNSHGTKCAGEIVMAPNNGKCGVGIAHGAKVGGIRLLDGQVTDYLEGKSLAIGHKEADIVTCSWGPTDDGQTVEGPARLSRIALEQGVKKGRNGKGLIYVWASGNGGKNDDNCNCDGYASSIYTISINSASQGGDPPWYTEVCSSTLASAYSSGAVMEPKIVTTDVGNGCTSDFSGTSAAAPLGAGIIALMLEKNLNLTWRDVQHIIVSGSEWKMLKKDSDGWRSNGIGLKFNHRFGFGLLDGQKVVNLASLWKRVPEKSICQTEAKIGSNNKILSGSSNKFSIETECKENLIVSLEHIELIVTLKHTKRGALKINIDSPMGTTTDLLTTRELDESRKGFEDWSLMSVHTWGEDPRGTWTIRIADTSKEGESGIIHSLHLRLHGTSTRPEHLLKL